LILSFLIPLQFYPPLSSPLQAVVVGMLEGIVPPTFEKEDYRNAPVWVEAADIKE
jgi:hypothetical protein